MRRVIPTVQVTSARGRNQGGFPRFAQFQDAEVNRKKNCHNILSINIPTLTKKNAVTTSKEPGKFSKDGAEAGYTSAVISCYRGCDLSRVGHRAISLG